MVIIQKLIKKIMRMQYKNYIYKGIHDIDHLTVVYFINTSAFDTFFIIIDSGFNIKRT